jgi:hypothetical protein
MTSLKLSAYNDFVAKLSCVNFAAIVQVLKNQGWKQDRIHKALARYGNFLFLLSQQPEQALIPDVEVDHLLHIHMESEAQFVDDCQFLLGGAIDHQAGFGARDEAERRTLLNAFKQTTALFNALFGFGAMGRFEPAFCFCRAVGTVSV